MRCNFRVYLKKMWNIEMVKLDHSCGREIFFIKKNKSRGKEKIIFNKGRRRQKRREEGHF